MEHRELSLAGKLDIGLARVVLLLLGGLKKSSLWLLGLLMLLSSGWMVFEYDEGLADISWHEWGFALLLLLLLWRHVHYCRHFTCGFWRGLTRLLMLQGILSVLSLSIIGVLLAVLLDSEHLDGFLRYLRQEEPFSKLVNYGSVLLATYLAAPTTVYSPITRAEQSARVEPTVPPMAREASS